MNNIQYCPSCAGDLVTLGADEYGCLACGEGFRIKDVTNQVIPEEPRDNIPPGNKGISLGSTGPDEE